MKERPISFSGEMVRAVLEGRKTQMRRVVKSAKWNESIWRMLDGGRTFCNERGSGPVEQFCPYGTPGDQLWVRESATITPKHWDDGGTFTHLDPGCNRRWVQYLATSSDIEAARGYGLKVTPANSMPRWASRIMLEITDIRVQRLQDISEADAIAEGVRANECVRFDAAGLPLEHSSSAQDEFRHLWDSISAKRGFGWDRNPWVFSITFRRVNASVQG